jgi:hypothetical protein
MAVEPGGDYDSVFPKVRTDPVFCNSFLTIFFL